MSRRVLFRHGWRTIRGPWSRPSAKTERDRYSAYANAALSLCRSLDRIPSSARRQTRDGVCLLLPFDQHFNGQIIEINCVVHISRLFVTGSSISCFRISHRACRPRFSSRPAPICLDGAYTKVSGQIDRSALRNIFLLDYFRTARLRNFTVKSFPVRVKTKPTKQLAKLDEISRLVFDSCRVHAEIAEKLIWIS